MAIGPDGAPFELDAVAPLPDNVVRALVQWRFQPGTRDGQPAAYAIGLNVPIHRPITAGMEFSLRRRWSTMNKEIKDAIKAGTALDGAAPVNWSRALRRILPACGTASRCLLTSPTRRPRRTGTRYGRPA